MLADFASSGFACAGDSASHEKQPQLASFRSVVVGILGNGHQLDRIYSTWLPELSQGHVYLMVDACVHATTSLSMYRRSQSIAKAHAARNGPATIQLVRHLTPTASACRSHTQTQGSCLPLAAAGLLRIAEGPRRCQHTLRRRGRELAAATAAQPHKHSLGETP